MKKLDIIYEDKEIIVINKPSGMLTIKAGNNISLYELVREYIKKQNPKNKIFIVHRLDKDTSGVILFARNEKTKRLLQENWSSSLREYTALVEGTPKKKKEKLINYLKESSSLQVYVTKDKREGKLAITSYEVIASDKKKSLLKIMIETGRKNQIRAQLSYIGHPIVGDKKYEAKMNPLNRLGLHATKLVIIHPKTKKEMTFLAKAPKSFEIVK